MKFIWDDDEALTGTVQVAFWEENISFGVAGCFSGFRLSAPQRGLFPLFPEIPSLTCRQAPAPGQPRGTKALHHFLPPG